MPFAEKRLGTWSELSDYAKPVQGWLYRGQRDAGWSLRTSLERCCDQRRITPARRLEIEKGLCRDFKRAYQQYGLHIPERNAALEWLALMQHHGAPTRLLDFTYSIYVAAYFAIEYADSDCAVWRIHGPWALRATIAALEKAGKLNASQLGRPYDETGDSAFGDNLVETTTACACPQTPFRLHERLRTQMGLFMAPGRIDQSFEENLRALVDHGKAQNVLKLVIPSGLRDEGLRQLFDMGLSRRSLFPGLDGYAQSLGVYTPVFNPVPWT
jgi:hypothetical protein